MVKSAQAIANPLSGPSLIAYLQPQSDDALHIDLISAQSGKSDGSKREFSKEVLSSEVPCATPFFEMDTCGPFARILPADLTLDNRNKLMALFLLVQPDRYSLARSELNPVNNPDVEACWQNALSRYHENPPTGIPRVPISQKDAQGRWVPFKPLFYCIRMEKFWHPLCPECGAELDLCRDDQLLETSGLPAFSQSLERFLFCPSCREASAPTVFYTRTADSRAASTEQESKLSDCSGLLKDFGRLQSNDDLAGKFPCMDCTHSFECYGHDHLVISRMTPVSFYPFYMLVSQAPGLNLIEFVMLLSGASTEEIAQRLKRQQRFGRLEIIQRFQSTAGQESGLFFHDGDRRFLEVLYLKLTLIQEIMALSNTDPGILATPMQRMSLEGFWVSLAGQSRRLPFFWTFDLKMIDIFGQSPSSDLDKCQGRRFLGMVWLHILLANRRQDAKTIHTGITDFLQREKDLDPEQSVPAEMVAVLAPSNLFWDSQPVELAPQWESFWKKSLSLGIHLLKSGITVDAGWSDQDFDEQLTELRDHIRIALFQSSGQLMPVKTAEPNQVDLKIATIVEDILRRWPAKSEDTDAPKMQEKPEPAPSAPPAPANEDGDVEETIILATEQGGNDVITRETVDATLKPASGPAEEPEDIPEKTVVVQMPPPETGEDLEKTVVMAAPPPSSDDELDKTRVVSPSQLETDHPDAFDKDELDKDELDKTVMISRPAPPSEDLEKTVVIGVQAHVSTGKRPKKQQDAAPADPAGGAADDLDQTVVITPPGSRTDQAGLKTMKPSSAKKNMNDEDNLEETVIIDPKQLKNRKPKP